MPVPSAVRNPRSRSDDVDSTSRALERASRWVRRATRPREANAVSLATLDVLASAGPQRVSDLSTSISVTQPGMTGVVTRLAEAGLAERRSDPNDGRVSRVAITRAGRAHLASARDTSTAVLAEHIRGLSLPQQRALAAAVEALDALGTDTPGDRPA